MFCNRVVFSNCSFAVKLAIKYHNLSSMYKIQACVHLKFHTSIFFYPKGDITLYSTVQFTSDSDLNNESPQFTLTCISTGGPATTLTWTRNSEELFGGTTVLNDTVSAQYTHTLTVTGRLGGLYQCTVSNNKPSQGTARLRVQGIVIIYYNMIMYQVSIFCTLYIQIGLL